MKMKKIPMRKCVACGEQKEKKELLRIVNNKDEGVLLDIRRMVGVLISVFQINVLIKLRKIKD